MVYGQSEEEREKEPRRKERKKEPSCLIGN
jgi:hypothetical protein